MNRADKMLSVLRDGRKHSRREIFDRIGYISTHNAACELRRRGYDVRHSQDGRDVHVYEQLSLEAV